MPFTKDFAAQILASPILIVDDNEINRIFLEKTLRSHGYTKIIKTSSGEEALAEMDRSTPEIVLLDIMMPDGMDGYECCKIIRDQSRYVDLPILIQTSLTEPELRVEAFKHGATDFISKPVHPEELCARVKVHLEKRHSLRALQRYKTRVAEELDSAKKLQLAILPSTEEIEDIKRRGTLSVAAYFEPCSEIGGDFWGIHPLFPHQTALWLVDFSGHGIAAALNAFRLQAYLKEHSLLASRPGEYLTHMNENLLHLLLPGQFATMFYGIVDTQNNQLFYACAFLSNPLILRRATGKVTALNGSGMPLGIGMNFYPTQSTPFAAGDLLFLYSDAFTETPDANDTYIDEQKIIDLLEQYPMTPPEFLKEILLSYFKQHTGGIMRDDLTLVVCAR